MKDWKEYIPTFKEFFNTLAGKLTAILAFALLVIIVLSWFGAGIPAEYLPLVYIVVIGAMLLFGYQAFLTANRAREKEAPPAITPRPPMPEPPEESQPVEVVTPEQALQFYLDAVIADNRPLRLAGLDEHAGDPNSVRLSLEEIYVALNTTTQVKVEKRKEKEELEGLLELLEQREETRPLPVIEALQRAHDRRMVLLGFPGTGKSTFVRYLALMMAQELTGAVRQVEGWDGAPLLPVAISLGRFAESLPDDAEKGHAGYLEDFLTQTLRDDKRTAPFAGHFWQQIQKRGALFLFDGLDEVARLSLRPIVVQSIEDFARRHGRDKRSYFLVTCRTYSYQDPRWQLTGWEQHELALLDDEQIRRFVTAWYEQHTLLDKRRAEEYAQKREKLLRALHPSDRRQLYKVARYPIILTVMAVVHASYELPDSRAQVYEQCVGLLLEKWNAKRSIMGRKQVRNILAELQVPRAIIDQALWEIAYDAHSGREDDSGSMVTEKLVSGVMREYLKEQSKVDAFLEYCEQSNGLLMLQGVVTTAKGNHTRKVYTFPHLTFEEYLAARYLDGEGGEKLRNLLDNAFDRWREVAVLLAEHLCFANPDRGRMNDILEYLGTPRHDPPDDKDWRAIWLAGELLTLYRRAFPKASPWDDRINKNLWHLIETAALTPRERASAADILDELGYLHPDLHRFVPIGNRQSQIYIGMFPVTNRQYARFLNAPDFADPALWRNFPKFDEHGQPMDDDWGNAGLEWLSYPRDWLGNKRDKNEDGIVYPRYWHDPRFGIARPSAPVVGVSWYEANAYCRWLAYHWVELEESRANPGLKPGIIRLPTETEWVLAAGRPPTLALPPRAGLRGAYPWDPPDDVRVHRDAPLDEILRRANVEESGIGRTTPVWTYPLGVCPATGVGDLGGNVWEWQANFTNNDHDVLALRGGSWHFDRSGVRLAARFSSDPYSSGHFIGFRVVVFAEERSGDRRQKKSGDRRKGNARFSLVEGLREGPCVRAGGV